MANLKNKHSANQPDNCKHYTQREEKANYLTHAFGAVMAVVATTILIGKAISMQNTTAVTAYIIFGGGMLLAMLSSTFYHYVQKPDVKAVLRHFDHGNIYVLIAASYAPFTLILLRNEGFWGPGLLILVWVIALVGIAFNFGTMKANNNLKTASYVLMGLTVFIAVKPMIDAAVANNCVNALYWLLAGGIFYIVGAVIYAKAKHEFVHAVFHVFVLLGMFCHIVSAWLVL